MLVCRIIVKHIIILPHRQYGNSMATTSGPVCTVPKDQKEFAGKVTEVVNGEVIVIKVGSVYKRVTLSSIRQPRPAEGTDAGPPSRALYEVPYLFEAREFLRKRLIGKKVNVTVDYVRPGANGYPERVCASVFLGSQNLQEAIVSKGLATVAWHKQDDDERAANYDALLLAQEKAKKVKFLLFCQLRRGGS